jgi:hypothetical protein
MAEWRSTKRGECGRDRGLSTGAKYSSECLETPVISSIYFKELIKRQSSIVFGTRFCTQAFLSRR